MKEVVAVTGGTGFVGSHLVRRLLAEGKSVRVLARDPKKAAKTLSPSVAVFTGNITDPATLVPFLDGASTVYHLASILQEPGTPDKVFWQVHVEGTKNLLEAFRRASAGGGSAYGGGVKNFIHFSTIGVMGAPRFLPADENSPYAARDIYQVTKREGEKAAIEAFRQNGMRGTVIRPTAVYGPGDMRLYKLFRTIAGGKFRMIGNGDIYIHPVHVEDLVAGALLAAERNSGGNGINPVYIVGGEKAVKLREFVDTIARTLNVQLKPGKIPYRPVWMAALLCEALCKPLKINPPIFRRRVEFFSKSRAFDITKAQRELGYVPRFGLDEGLRQTCTWYQSQGLL